MTLGSIVDSIEHGCMSPEQIIRISAEIIIKTLDSGKINDQHSLSRFSDDMKEIASKLTKLLTVKVDKSTSTSSEQVLKIYGQKLCKFEPMGD